ncbi:MAG: TlpA family protein disulfide reductase [Leptospiraceae bacterium]|nr:TlpA family protein disulfide reductase [Leptospiraceae bacterium]MDW8306911.1 TlpA disulfide reductase family protein [Leptospiraceae bacterium]
MEVWLNTPPLRLKDLRGQIVVLYFFQMLCPACVMGASILANKIHENLLPEVKLIGVHSVFEHHEAMQKKSLEAYLYEFRYRFPVGIDAPSEGGIPRTMSKLKLRGTPTFILVDREGYIRQEIFGLPDELILGYLLGKLAMNHVGVRP